MRLIRMKIKCDNFFFSFCANAFHGTDSLWVPFGDGGWAGSGGYGVSREFQLRNDKVSGQQQSLSHKKKSFLWGVNKTSALSLSLSLSHFLGIFAFCVLGILLKPQVAWLHPTRENLAKTTQWGSLYLPLPWQRNLFTNLICLPRPAQLGRAKNHRSTFSHSTGGLRNQGRKFA